MSFKFKHSIFEGQSNFIVPEDRSRVAADDPAYNTLREALEKNVFKTQKTQEVTTEKEEGE
jgi:hypothetical protein